MAINHTNEKTAEIYAFPPRHQKKTATRIALMEAEARKYSATEFGSGWYHDEAISRPVKNEQS